MDENTWICRRCGGTEQAKNGQCKACSKTYRQVYEKTPRRRASKFFRERGITIEQRDELCQKQNGCCAICGKHKALFADHDHSTGRGVNGYGGSFRGLLCTKCNQGIGLFNDDPAILASAISYLTKTPYQRIMPLCADPKPIYCECKPCKLCGGTKRYIKSRNCVPCYVAKQRSKRIANAGRIAQ